MLKRDVQHDGPIPAGGEPRFAKSDRVHGLAAIVAWLGAAIELHVPLGYEDETGFHIGAKPFRTESSQYLRSCEQDEAFRDRD
jgi:hypothetical protein